MRYFDLHCDTLTELYEAKRHNPTVGLARNTFHISLQKAAGLNAYCQTFAIWTPDGISSPEACKYFYRVLALFKDELRKNEDIIRLCKSAQDIEDCARQGITAALLSIEGGRAAMGSLECLHDFYAEGVRLFGLVWKERGALGDSCAVPDAGGLTPLGHAFIAEMERLGMIPDVSHLSDAGFWQVCETAHKPFAATHSNARAVCGHARNLTDAMFSELAARGGLVGINLCKEFLEDDADKANAKSVVRHIEHFMALGGERAVAMGADFDGAAIPRDLCGIDQVTAIAEALLRANYPQALVENLLWGNALEFFKKNLA